jgi:hypothetical protein
LNQQDAGQEDVLTENSQPAGFYFGNFDVAEIFSDIFYLAGVRLLSRQQGGNARKVWLCVWTQGGVHFAL